MTRDRSISRKINSVCFLVGIVKLGKRVFLTAGTMKKEQKGKSDYCTKAKEV
jgi:hypothetical protein